MKEIKIALSGEKEEQIAQHIMKSVYEAINEHGYCDILISGTMNAKKIKEKARQQPQKRHTHQRDGAKKAAPPSIRLASL